MKYWFAIRKTCLGVVKMKTIGEILRSERKKIGKTLADLEHETKIKRNYLSALEKEQWTKLPNFPVVVGFVKNIASAVGIDREKAVATLRRDYPPQKIAVNPKPDVREDFKWGPRLTFFILALLTISLIGFYLAFQYWRFQRPPKLTVNSPQENQIVTESNLTVEGVIEDSVSVTVNGQPSQIEEDGKFLLEIEVNEQLSEIEVIARSRSGKETVVKRKIKVEF